jgi:hypothetical protein
VASASPVGNTGGCPSGVYIGPRQLGLRRLVEQLVTALFEECAWRTSRSYIAHSSSRKAAAISGADGPGHIPQRQRARTSSAGW